MKLNLPNKLTLLRLALIPVCMACILFPIGSGDLVWRLLAAAAFGAASITDLIDGKIARKYNLVTDLGKFLDPVADKLLVFGALLALMTRYRADDLFSGIFVWAVFLVILRETAVTSLRMIAASKAGLVIAAAWLGKVKTTTQMTCILVLLLEGALPFETYGILGYISIAAMVIMTVWSGIDYLIQYLPLLKDEKDSNA